MATFPTLTPSSRTFTPGRHPHSEIPTLNGLQVRVMSSNVILEQQLRLSFIGLTEAQMLSIRSHYIGQQGRFLSFVIPDSLLSGMTTPAYFTPTAYSWIYSSSPQVEDIPGTQRYTVSVELITVPPEGANLNGADFTVSIGLVAGLAEASVNNAGATFTVTASIEGGVVADNSSAGFDLSVAASFVGGAATVPSSDPDFASVSLLLHLNGTNGGTTFTDSSSNAVSMTRGGNAALSTTFVKYGTASVVWDGNGDFLRTPSSALFTFGTGDFTIEFWSYFDASFNTANANILMSIGNFRNIMYIGNTLRYRSEGASNLITGAALNLSQWYHIALTKSGSDHKLFIDGTQTGSTYTNATSYTVDRITFGANNSGTNNYLGNQDDVRVTKGVARYTANFTAPTAAFPDA